MLTVTETGQAKRDRLWAYANGPRAPRSRAYMSGIEAKLCRLGGGAPITSPYRVGTAECDAWYAGVAEADFLWNNDEITLRALTPSTRP